MIVVYKIHLDILLMIGYDVNELGKRAKAYKKGCFIIIALAAAFFKKLKHRICASYHRGSILKQILNKSQEDRLMNEEQFEPLQFQAVDIQRYQLARVHSGLCSTAQHQKETKQTKTTAIKSCGNIVLY